MQPGQQGVSRPWSRRTPFAEHPIERWDDVHYDRESTRDDSVRCSGCGGLHLLDRVKIEAVCSFCQSPLNAAELRDVGHSKIQGVVPFGITATDAQHAVAETIAGTFGLPRSIRRLVTEPPVFEGVYLPCFTFDANLSGSYVAEIRHNRSITRIDGTAHAQVDDAIIPVADRVGITASVCERTAPSFSPEDLRPLSGDYLAGFHVTLPVFDIHEARALAQTAFHRQFSTAALIDRSDEFSNIGGTGRIVECDFTASKVRARLVLLPFWFAHYKHKDVWLTIAVDGNDGRVGIEHPGHGNEPWLIAVGALGLVFAYLAIAHAE